MSRLHVQVHDSHQLLASTTFLRVLQALQASYLLVLRGLPHDAAVVLRSAFEALCLLRACRKNPDVAFDFVSADEIEQLKLANVNIIRLRKRGDKDLLRQLEKGKSELEDNIKKAGTKKVSAFDLAQAAGLDEVYDTMWRIVSKHAHTSPRALEDFLVISGSELSVNYAPDYREAGVHLATIAEFSLMAQAELGLIFSMDASSGYEKLSVRFNHLVSAES